MVETYLIKSELSVSNAIYQYFDSLLDYRYRKKQK